MLEEKQSSSLKEKLSSSSEENLISSSEEKLSWSLEVNWKKINLNGYQMFNTSLEYFFCKNISILEYIAKTKSRTNESQGKRSRGFVIASVNFI